MATEYLISPTGQYVKQLTGTPAEIIYNTPEGSTTTLVPPARSSDYWNGTNWVDIGNPPDAFKVFDYSTKTWKDFRNLDDIKKQKWQQIKMERNVLEFSGFDWEGHRFDSDQISQGRLLAASLFGKTVEWTLQDDTIITLEPEDLQSVIIAMAAHVTSAHDRARIARVLIDDAKTIDAVYAVLL